MITHLFPNGMVWWGGKGEGTGQGRVTEISRGHIYTVTVQLIESIYIINHSVVDRIVNQNLRFVLIDVMT